MSNNKFKEFYWGVFRIMHRGCSFVEMSRMLNLMVHPIFIEIPRNRNEPIPFYSEVDQYLPEQETMKQFEEGAVPNLSIYSVSPDFDRQKTLIVGKAVDEIVETLLTDPSFEGTCSKLYAMPDFEYLPVLRLKRSDLDELEESLGKIAESLGGTANLDTIGKISSMRDLEFWKKTTAPEPGGIPGLTKNEIRILDVAIAYGYYKRPRDLTLGELADKLGIPKATLGRRLQDIENRVVNNSLYSKTAYNIR